MILVTLLWSTAGVVTRHLDAARSFEVTFWRSAFNALALSVALTVMRGPALWRGIVRAPWPVWVSGLCWSVMYTAFMVAITLTSVANVLVTMSSARCSRRCCRASCSAIGWRAHLGARSAWPASASRGCSARSAGLDAGATRRHRGRAGRAGRGGHQLDAAAAHATTAKRADDSQDMMSAVLIGALISALAMLPLSLPFQASAHDLSLLALLGVFQLAVPCLLVVRLTHVLPGPEIALLGLLEVVLGVAWAVARATAERATLAAAAGHRSGDQALPGRSARWSPNQALCAAARPLRANPMREPDPRAH